MLTLVIAVQASAEEICAGSLFGCGHRGNQGDQKAMYAFHGVIDGAVTKPHLLLAGMQNMEAWQGPYLRSSVAVLLRRGYSQQRQRLDQSLRAAYGMFWGQRSGKACGTCLLRPVVAQRMPECLGTHARPPERRDPAPCHCSAMVPEGEARLVRHAVLRQGMILQP